MCISRHKHLFIAVALLDKLIEKSFRECCDVTDLVANKKLEVEQHLVVSRASAVDFLTRVAQSACEHQFHLGMDILHPLLNLELSFLNLLIDGFEFFDQLPELIFRE